VITGAPFAYGIVAAQLTIQVIENKILNGNDTVGGMTALWRLVSVADWGRALA
jgi:hypothetical protein